MSTPSQAMPAAREQNERIHALDSLRATAMFLGIVIHVACSFTTKLPLPWAARDAASHWTFDLLFGVLHGFRMQLFFFLGGFFARLLYVRLGQAGFAKHRLKRIGLPFLAGLFTILPITLLLFMWGITRLDPLPIFNELQPRGGHIPFPLIHLWFLQYLLALYICVFPIVWLIDRLPAKLFSISDKLFDRMIDSPLRALAFVPFALVLLWDGPIWGEADIRGMTLIPPGRDLMHFGLFFAAGWWLHRRREKLPALTRYLTSSFLLAPVALAAYITILASKPLPSNPNYLLLKATCLASGSLYAWLMTFALTGWFLRFASEPKPWARYLADASYFCYLAHLPLVIFLQVLLASWKLSGWLKFPLMTAVAMAILLLLYEYRVRYTWVGRVLNGPRTRPNGGVLAAPVAAT